MIHCVSLCDMLLFSRDFSKPLYLLRGTHCHFIDILPSHYTCLTFCCLIEILASHFISLWLVPTRSLMHPVTKYLSDFADVGREKTSRKKICLLSIKCEVFISLSYDRILCRICFTLVLSCLFCLFHLFHHYVSIFVCNLLHNVSLLVSPILFCSQIMGLKQFTNGSCIAELSFPFQ